MGIRLFDRLVAKLTGAGSATSAVTKHAGITQDREAVWVKIQCENCGEILNLRLRKSAEIQREYSDADYEFFVNKEVVGNNCRNVMSVRLELDGRYRPISVSTKNCSLVG